MKVGRRGANAISPDLTDRSNIGKNITHVVATNRRGANQSNQYVPVAKGNALKTTPAMPSFDLLELLLSVVLLLLLRRINKRD